MNCFSSFKIISGRDEVEDFFQVSVNINGKRLYIKMTVPELETIESSDFDLHKSVRKWFDYKVKKLHSITKIGICYFKKEPLYMQSERMREGFIYYQMEYEDNNLSQQLSKKHFVVT